MNLLILRVMVQTAEADYGLTKQPLIPVNKNRPLQIKT